eukprot:1138963-Pelagomonas_calceolata.AAC.2
MQGKLRPSCTPLLLYFKENSFVPPPALHLHLQQTCNSLADTRPECMKHLHIQRKYMQWGDCMPEGVQSQCQLMMPQSANWWLLSPLLSNGRPLSAKTTA